MSGLHVVHVVCTDAFAGVERYVSNSAICLQDAGCRVTVVGGAEVAMRAALSQHGVDWMPGRTVREALRSLRRVDHPTVINTHMTQADLAGTVIGALRHVPVVSTRHFASLRGSRPVSRLLAVGIGRLIVDQIAISRFVAASIEGGNTVVHTGVGDVDPVSGPREPLVLVLQRLEAEKHTELALRAWARVADRGGWRIAVAGEGREFEMLRALSHALGIDDSVDFLGFQADVGSLLRRAAILLAPTPREGLGLAVIEAMAHGVPVVACGAGGHLESVGEVEGAALFSPGDSAGAALQLTRLMRDPAERERYGAALRDRQRVAFSQKSQTEATVRVFARAVEG
ncbi:MAG: glycosyltransferase family 4 protein [Demequinaceae bacterium]|nr:glycosyltransferase family 4 protein [Demequinaceae bacterium]